VETSLEKQPYESTKEYEEYGGFWLRFAAYLIDSIIVGIPLTILSIVIFMIFFGTSDAFNTMISDPSYMETEMTNEEAFAFMGSYFGALGVTFRCCCLFCRPARIQMAGNCGQKAAGIKSD
jgi:ABC-type multidrug transport system permease subunit